MYNDAEIIGIMKLKHLLILYLALIFLLLVSPLDAAVGTYLTNKINASSVTKLTYRSDGKLLKNGEPWFPFGFYHSSWIGERRGDLLVSDLNMIADAGFDLIHPTISPLSRTTEFRKVAAQRGVFVIASYYRPDATATITALKDDPIIVGWNVGDDIGMPYQNPREGPELIKERHDLSKSLDPNSLTYGAVGSHPLYPMKNYINTMDIMGPESYPVSNLSGPWTNALAQNMGVLMHTRYIFPQNKPMLALLQAYKWEIPGGRYPTAPETRNMTYAALIADYDGLLPYAFYAGKGILPNEAPDQWEEFKKLKKDIDKLKPILIGGKLTMYDSLGEVSTLYPLTPGKYPPGIQNPRIHAGIWEYQNKLYVVAINTSNTQTIKAAIPLPKLTNESATKFINDSRYGDGLIVKDGSLVGNMLPESVHIYEIPLTPSSQCVGDYTNDGQVNIGDFEIFAQNYKIQSAICSLDLFGGNCYLDESDFAVFENVYKKTPCVKNV